MPASPSLGGSASRRVHQQQQQQPGENEAKRLWEDFFLSQKKNLSSSEIAKIRDQTGYLGLAGI